MFANGLLSEIQVVLASEAEAVLLSQVQPATSPSNNVNLKALYYL